MIKVNKKYLSKNINVSRKLPVNIVDKDLKLFKHELKKSFPSNYVINEQNCLIFGQNIFSPKKFKLFKKETFFGYPSLKKILKDTIKNLISLRRVEIIKDGYWITDDKSTVYFHWFCDALQKTAYLDLISNKKLLIPKRFIDKEFIKDSLELLNINYQTLRPDTLYLVKSINIIGETAPTGNYNPSTLKQLQEMFYKKVNIETKEKKKKLWIMRENDKRSIENSDKIYSLLQEYGFEFIYFEKLSIKEKIVLLHNCQYLGGVWGSGLTNMIFMLSGSNLIEVRNKNDDQNNAFFSMASALNINYYYFVSIFAKDKSSVSINARDFKLFLESINI